MNKTTSRHQFQDQVIPPLNPIYGKSKTYIHTYIYTYIYIYMHTLVDERAHGNASVYSEHGPHLYPLRPLADQGLKGLKGLKEYKG